MFTFHKNVISPYIECKSGTYSPQSKELTSKHNTIIKNPLLFFVYLFRRNVGEDVVKKALGNNRLPCVIPKKDSTHTNVCQVYKQEVCPKAFHAIILPLLLDMVSIINIYGGGAFPFLHW